MAKKRKVVAKLVERKEEVVEAPVVEEAPVEVVKEAPVEVAEEAPVQKWNGEVITNVENRISNGKMYKDIRTVVATYMESPEDFEAGVTTV